MNPDVMSNPSADPFSDSQSSYPQQHMTDGGSSSRSSDYTAQQQSTWAPGTAPATAHNGPATAAVQPQRQHGQPIFFQGQWFMPAPPGFTPPPGLAPPVQQQQLYGGVNQHLQGPLQGPQNPQAPSQQHHQQQGDHLHSQQPRQLHQQQQLYHQQPQQLQQQQQWQHQQPSLYARTPLNAHMSSGHLGSASGQSAAAPGLTSANTAAAKDQVWSPTSAYQFESPTFRNGAAQQLSPGESGRTWSPVASDITRLTLPQTEAAPQQQKVSLPVCLSIDFCGCLVGWLSVDIGYLFTLAMSNRYSLCADRCAASHAQTHLLLSLRAYRGAVASDLPMSSSALRPCAGGISAVFVLTLCLCCVCHLCTICTLDMRNCVVQCAAQSSDKRNLPLAVSART